MRDISAGGSSTLTDFIKISDGKLRFVGTDYKVNWTPNKWYNLEWVVEPGNGTDIKNKVTVYIDGKKIADADFDANKNTAYSAMTGVGEFRMTLDNGLNGWGQQADFVKSGTRAGFNMYIDDYSIRKTSDNTVEPVTVTAQGITTGYEGVLFIKNNETIGDMKAKVSVSGATCEYVSASGETLSDDKPAAGAYLKATAADATVYYYGIFDKIMWHQEDFESYDVIANTAYKGTVFNKAANTETSGAKNLAGKSGQAFAFDYTESSGVYSDTSFMDFNRGAAIPVEDNTVIEFSMYANPGIKNGLCVGAGAAYSYEYTDAEGNTVTATDGMHDLVTMEKGHIYAGSSIDGNEICDAKDGRWYKIALQLDPAAYTMDIYVNGELVKTGVSLNKIDYVVENDVLVPVDRTLEKTGGAAATLKGISRLKLGGAIRGVGGENTGKLAYDDIKFYAGSYDAAQDAADVVIKNYDTSKKGVIKINSDEDDLDKSEFLKNISLSDGVKSATLYDDATLSGSENIDENGVSDGCILAVETNSGTMHYYVIRDTAIAASTEFSLFSGDEEVEKGASFAAGKYTLKATVTKVDDEEENYTVILAVKKAGELVDLQFAQAALSEAGTVEIPVELNVTDTDGITFEAYAWDTLSSMVAKRDMQQW